MAVVLLHAAAVAGITVRSDSGMRVSLCMTAQQKLDAISTMVGTLTYEQWDALKARLDKEFAS